MRIYNLVQRDLGLTREICTILIHNCRYSGSMRTIPTASMLAQLSKLIAVFQSVPTKDNLCLLVLGTILCRVVPMNSPEGRIVLANAAFKLGVYSALKELIN